MIAQAKIDRERWEEEQRELEEKITIEEMALDRLRNKLKGKSKDENYWKERAGELVSLLQAINGDNLQIIQKKYHNLVKRYPKLKVLQQNEEEEDSYDQKIFIGEEDPLGKENSVWEKLKGLDIAKDLFKRIQTVTTTVTTTIRESLATGKRKSNNVDPQLQ